MVERSRRGRFAPASIVIAVAAAVLATSCSGSGSSAAPVTATNTSSSPAATPTTPAKPTTREPCATPRPHAAGQFSQTFDFDGVQRTYQLYVPKAYRGAVNVPVVFDFHGFGSNAIEQMVYGNFKPLADTHDFLIVAPDGQGAAAGRHFNLTNESGLQNDIAMTLALLDHIEGTLCIDTDRVDATGMSDGGAMASVLACVAFNRFAAFGAVAVEVFRPGCAAKQPVSILGIHGTADPVVPFTGGKVHCCGGAAVAAAPATMAAWAAHDSCATAFVDTRLGTEVRRRVWSGCAGGSSVVFYIIDGGGHTWPGSIAIARLGKTTDQLDASAVIWAFFAAHPLH